MSNINIYFIRHGEVDNPNRRIYGRTDIPLSMKGFQQIESLAMRLKDSGVRPDVIYSSVQRRTLQSAKKISEVFAGVRIVPKSALQEVYAPGLLGKPLELVKKIGDIFNCEDTKDFSIERPEAIVDRVLSVVEGIKQDHRGKTVFVVGHGDPFAFTIWRLLHPEGNLPSIATLLKDAYLDKGEAWKIVLDRKGRVLESEIIVQNEERVKGEKGY